jgi:hypothetical protein
MPDPLRSVERLMKEIVPRGIHTCLGSARSKIDLIPCFRSRRKMATFFDLAE